jgi:hypothetical protein
LEFLVWKETIWQSCLIVRRMSENLVVLISCHHCLKCFVFLVFVDHTSLNLNLSKLSHEDNNKCNVCIYLFPTPYILDGIRTHNPLFSRHGYSAMQSFVCRLKPSKKLWKKLTAWIVFCRKLLIHSKLASWTISSVSSIYDPL